MIIYKITNIINDKIYIGQTTGKFLNRIKAHIKGGKNTYISRAIEKYGKENFKFKILEECETKEELNEMEFHYIKQFNTLRPNGYNLTLGGEGNYGWLPNKETRKKIQIAQKKWWSNRSLTEKQELVKHLTYIARNNNPMKGKKRPEITGKLNPACRFDVREKISTKLKGKKRPDLSKTNTKRCKGKTFEEMYGKEKAEILKLKYSKSFKESEFVGKYERTDEFKKKCKRCHVKFVYKLISPMGEEFIIDNMREFCEKNPHLNRSSMMSLVKGNNKKGIYKGWKGEIISK